ncbi:Dynamin N-terminal domain-containing protein [Entamoeba marina]
MSNNPNRGNNYNQFEQMARDFLLTKSTQKIHSSSNTSNALQNESVNYDVQKQSNPKKKLLGSVLAKILSLVYSNEIPCNIVFENPRCFLFGSFQQIKEVIEVLIEKVCPIENTSQPIHVHLGHSSHTTHLQFNHSYFFPYLFDIDFIAITSSTDQIINTIQQWIIPYSFFISVEQTTEPNKQIRSIISHFDSHGNHTHIVKLDVESQLKKYQSKELNQYIEVNPNTTFLNSTNTIVDIQSKHKDKYIELFKLFSSLGLEDLARKKIGAINVTNAIEMLIYSLYSTQISKALSQFHSTISTLETRLETIQNALTKTTQTNNKTNILYIIDMFVKEIDHILKGETTASPLLYGETLEEERKSTENWSEEITTFPVENSELKLFGGAQYERLLLEITNAILLTDLSLPSKDEVVVALGIRYDGDSVVRALRGILQKKSKDALLPLIRISLKRMNHVVYKMGNIATDNLQFDGLIKDWLIEQLQYLIDSTQKQLEEMIYADVNALTSCGDLRSIFHAQTTSNEQILSTKDRVIEMIQKHQEDEDSLIEIIQDIKPWEGNDKTYDNICNVCKKLFDVIRWEFNVLLRNKLNSYFLTPIVDTLKNKLTTAFELLNDDDCSILITSENEEQTKKQQKFKEDMEILLKHQQSLNEAKDLLQHINETKNNVHKTPSLVQLNNPIKSPIHYV